MKRPHGVVVASKNADKIVEVEAVLASLEPQILVIDGHTWPDVEETEDSLSGNALLKARAVVAATGHAAIADDTGLEVDALGGAPGVTTARYAGKMPHTMTTSTRCCVSSRGWLIAEHVSGLPLHL